MDISVVVPLYNEEESLPELTVWIDHVMQDNNFSYEVILVDDGSTDGLGSRISNLESSARTTNIDLKIIRQEKLCPSAKIIMLTNQADQMEMAKALGVDGYIIKASTIPSEVVQIVMDTFNKK